ncbi:MAG: hypothetical protein JW751_25780 [Polyangiaceae bacterium]|nr:hypothetical protein [Polyangiaceae bacterium]
MAWVPASVPHGAKLTAGPGGRARFDPGEHLTDDGDEPAAGGPDLWVIDDTVVGPEDPARRLPATAYASSRTAEPSVTKGTGTVLALGLKLALAGLVGCGGATKGDPDKEAATGGTVAAGGEAGVEAGGWAGSGAGGDGGAAGNPLPGSVLCEGIDACGGWAPDPACPSVMPTDKDPCPLADGTSCTYCDGPPESWVDTVGGSLYHGAYCLNGSWDVNLWVGCSVDRER